MHFLSNFSGFSLRESERIWENGRKFSPILLDFFILSRILRYCSVFFRIFKDCLEFYPILLVFSYSSIFSCVLSLDSFRNISDFIRFSWSLFFFDLFCIVSYSSGFFLILPDSLGLFHLLWIHFNFCTFLRIFSYSLGFFRIRPDSLDSLEFYPIFWDFFIFSRFVPYSFECS